MTDTLYYTIHDWGEEFGEGSTINLYRIVDNKPILVQELERDLSLGWTIQEELDFYVEEWDNDITYLFIKL